MRKVVRFPQKNGKKVAEFDKKMAKSLYFFTKKCYDIRCVYRLFARRLAAVLG